MIKHIAIPILALGLAACEPDSGESAAPAEQASPTISVGAESISDVLSVQGSVVASRRSTLSTRMMAHVTDVLVEVGDRVRSGQTLIRLGVDDVAAKRAMAEAAAAAARAARDEAERHAARMDALLAQDAVARVQRDRARLALAHAESGLLMAEAALREVDTAERYASIRAPFDGRVVSRHIDEGDLSAPGLPLLVIEADGPREAVLDVPADAARTLEVGSTIDVISTGGERTVARVSAVASGADPRSRTIRVRALLPSSWTSGTAVTALLPAGTRVGVTIPWGAVVRRGQLTGVRVVTPDGVLLRWVRLGRSVSPTQTEGEDSEPRVEVLSGLSAGERIVP